MNNLFGFGNFMELSQNLTTHSENLHIVGPSGGLCVVCRQPTPTTQANRECLTFFWRLRRPGIPDFLSFFGGPGVQGSRDSGFFDVFWRLWGPGCPAIPVFLTFFWRLRAPESQWCAVTDIGISVVRSHGY